MTLELSKLGTQILSNFINLDILLGFESFEAVMK